MIIKKFKDKLTEAINDPDIGEDMREILQRANKMEVSENGFHGTSWNPKKVSKGNE